MRLPYYFWPEGEASAMCLSHRAWMDSQHTGIQFTSTFVNLPCLATAEFNYLRILNTLKV